MTAPKFAIVDPAVPVATIGDLEHEIAALRHQLDCERADHRATQRLAERSAAATGRMLEWSKEQSGALRLVRNTLQSIANGVVEDPAARAAQVLAQLDERPGDPLLSETLAILADALIHGHHSGTDEYAITADHAAALTIHLCALGVQHG